jgi:hypothetical protein
MVTSLDPYLISEKNKTSKTSPPIWLFEIEVDANTTIRVTPYESQITYEGNIFYPMAIEHDGFESSTDDMNANATIVAYNADGQIGAYLWDNLGLTDKQVYVYLVESSDLTKGFYYFGSWEIVTCELTRERAVFTLGPLYVFSRQGPRQKHDRVQCQNQFGGKLGLEGPCGYDTSLPGAMQTCSKFLEGKDGCIAHGNCEVARNLKRKHPQNFRAFPGMAKARA